MATIDQIRRLRLSAEEIQGMTGWPEALIEDYLNILDNTILLATTIDGEIDTLEETIAALNNTLQELEVFRAAINKKSQALTQIVTTTLDSAEQLIASLQATARKLLAKIQALEQRTNDIEQVVYTI